MKTLKLSVVFLLSILFLSCDKDESLSPLPLIVQGSYVRLDITNKRINFFDKASTFFGGKITTPGNNVAKYNLYVRRTNISGITSDFVLFKTITSFPADLKVTAADLASTFQVSEASIAFAETYRFYGESFDFDNNRTDYYGLSAVIQSAPSMKQGYRFYTDITDNDGFNPLDLLEFDNYITQ